MKNIQIELWRFAFAIYMVVYHTLGHVYNVQTGGYIGVDVFAIIAGFFLAVSHNKMVNNGYRGGGGVTNYIVNRFVRLWPMCFSAYLISVVLRTIRLNLSITQVIEQIYRSFPEMFMLRIGTSINGVTWYITAMLISSILLWVCLTLDPQKKWAPGLILIAALWIYSIFMKKLGRIHFNSTQNTISFGYDGVWRIFADMGIGVLAFLLIQAMEWNPQDETMRTALRLVGSVGFTLVLSISLFKYHGFCDFWFIFIAWCSLVCLVLSEQPLKEETSISKAICYLGGLAYPIYLLHEAVFAMIKTYSGISSPILGCVVVIAITMLEAAFLNKILKETRTKLKRICEL